MTIYCTSCGNEFTVQGEVRDGELVLAHPSQMPLHCNKCGTRTFTTEKPEKPDVRNKETEKRAAEAAKA